MLSFFPCECRSLFRKSRFFYRTLALRVRRKERKGSLQISTGQGKMWMRKDNNGLLEWDQAFLPLLCLQQGLVFFRPDGACKPSTFCFTGLSFPPISNPFSILKPETFPKVC
jgi:hypothetical protein